MQLLIAENNLASNYTIHFLAMDNAISKNFFGNVLKCALRFQSKQICGSNGKENTTSFIIMSITMHLKCKTFSDHTSGVLKVSLFFFNNNYSF